MIWIQIPVLPATHSATLGLDLPRTLTVTCKLGLLSGWWDNVLKAPLHSVWDVVDAWLNLVSLPFCFKKKSFGNFKHLFDLMPGRIWRIKLLKHSSFSSCLVSLVCIRALLLVSLDWYLHNRPGPYYSQSIQIPQIYYTSQFGEV